MHQQNIEWYNCSLVFQFPGPRGDSCHFFKWRGRRWKLDSKVDSIVCLLFDITIVWPFYGMTIFCLRFDITIVWHQYCCLLLGITGGNKEHFSNHWASWSSWCSWSPSTGSTAPSTSTGLACSPNLGEATDTLLSTLIASGKLLKNQSAAV